MAEPFPTVRYANNRRWSAASRGNLAFTVSYSIAKDSKKKSAAWTLLAYLTGRQGMAVWTSKVGYLPSRSDVSAVAGRPVPQARRPSRGRGSSRPGFARVMTPPTAS